MSRLFADQARKLLFAQSKANLATTQTIKSTVSSNLKRFFIVLGVGVPLVVGTGITTIYNGIPVLFSPTLRLLLLCSKPFTKLEVNFGQARGSLKNGTLELENCTIRRKGNKRLDMDLDLKKIRIVYKEPLKDWLLNPQQKLR